MRMGISVTHKLLSSPNCWDKSQKIWYVIKSGFFGPNKILSKIKSLKKNATVAPATIAIVQRINNHLSSSKWSKKDISFAGFFAIIQFLLLKCHVNVKFLGNCCCRQLLVG